MTELHPDLKPYLFETSFFPMLKHPLVFMTPYIPNMAEYANKFYEQKKRMIQDYLSEKNYSGYIYAHERPYRIMAFIQIEPKLNPQEYWEVFSDVWIDSENIWQNKSTYKHLLSKHPNFRRHFMSEEDLAVYDSLPEQVVIYRGFLRGKNKTGFSYTLNPEMAQWFANRFGNGEVLERTVSKSKIIAYTNRRGEEEVIVL